MNTNPAALVLTSSVPASVTNDIRGLKAPVEIPTAWTWLWWILGLAAVGVLAWLAWRRWRKKAAAAAPEIIVPPHVRAKEKLRAALALISEPRPFCISVSDTIRVYLEERFELHAPDRTTEEFLDELQSSALLTIDQKKSLGEFLVRCDLVKFARYEPWETELRDLHDAAARLVDETQFRTLPPAGTEGSPSLGIRSDNVAPSPEIPKTEQDEPRKSS
jgi:hypothetical protein